MVTDFFGSFLQELGTALNIPNLHPDVNNSCLIKFKNGIQVQFEVDKSGEFLIVGSDLGDVPPGKYRENIFTEALKANTLVPQTGIFAYSKQSDHLILFQRFLVKDLTANKIADFIPAFLDKANLWKDSIARGTIPPLPSSFSSGSASGLFGLKP